MIHINIGSNIDSKFGNRVDNITKAIFFLKKANLNIFKISNFYETPSYPNKKKPKFLNIGLLANFNLDYLSLLNEAQLVENKIGRFRSTKNEPRVCDIDIIDFNGELIKTNDLIIPHLRGHMRNFVLYPIKQIDPDWTHPFLKQNVNFLIKKLDLKSRIEITRLNKNVNIGI